MLSDSIITTLGLSDFSVAAAASCGIAATAMLTPASTQPTAAHLRALPTKLDFCFIFVSLGKCLFPLNTPVRSRQGAPPSGAISLQARTDQAYPA